jgi:16S rRNA (cytosine967-C5)-methyltransferase
MTKEENIENINWFVDNFPFELEDISTFLPNKISELTAKQGYIQLYPNIHDTDGFFIARLRRKR